MVEDEDLETNTSFSVIDFGQINPVSFTTNTRDSDDIHLVGHKWVDEKSGINWSQKFDKTYRRRVPDYQKYLDEVSEESSKTSDPDKFGHFCKMTAKWDKERRMYRQDARKLAMKTRIREKRQKTTASLARIVSMVKTEDIKNELAGNREKIKIDKDTEMLFVNTAFFGDGAVNIRGKGHRGYSKKGVIRACASSIFPGGKRVRACVFNEAYTSSRCPSCKSTPKMKTQGGRRDDKEDEDEGEREREDENESQPNNGNPGDSETPTTITTSPTLEKN